MKDFFEKYEELLNNFLHWIDNHVGR